MGAAASGLVIGRFVRQANGREFAGYANTNNFIRHYNANNQWVGYTDLQNQNQLVGTGLFQYDANGNPTVYKGKAAEYDADNRLTSYDGGLRAWKQNTETEVHTFFLYDGNNIIC